MGRVTSPSTLVAACGHEDVPITVSGNVTDMAMSGPKHYREAARLLDKAKGERDPVERGLLLAEAQVNVTFALIAATVFNGTAETRQILDWTKVGVGVHG